jgi:hypothetical protein
MQEISRTYNHPKAIDVEISEIKDGIYRISGLGVVFFSMFVENFY